MAAEKPRSQLGPEEESENEVNLRIAVMVLHAKLSESSGISCVR